MNSADGLTTTLTPIDHITSVTSTTTTLAVMILALLIGAVVSLVLAHILDRGVNPIRDAVSDYGAREYKILYRLTAFWIGFAGLLMAVMLGDAIFPKPTLVILLLLLFAGTRWAITLFPVDLPGEEDTGTGRSHVVLATMAFGAFAIAAAVFPMSIADDPFWANELNALRTLGYATAALAIATAVTHRLILTNIFGLVERLYYAAMIGWLATISIIFLST